MSTITQIQITDPGNVHKTVYTDNFANLNTDKIEAGSTETLTNKTISASNNTITGLTGSTIDSSDKTGTGKIVTGVVGVENTLAQVSGTSPDLYVDSSGRVVVEGEDRLDDLISGFTYAVPTEEHAQYVSTHSGRILLTPSMSTGTSDSGVGTFYGKLMTAGDIVYFNVVPPDINADDTVRPTNAYFSATFQYIERAVGGSGNFTFRVRGLADGEDVTAATEETISGAFAVATANRYRISGIPITTGSLERQYLAKDPTNGVRCLGMSFEVTQGEMILLGLNVALAIA